MSESEAHRLQNHIVQSAETVQLKQTQCPYNQKEIQIPARLGC